MSRRVNPGFDSDDTKGLPLFAGCDATVPDVVKLEGGPAAPLRSMPLRIVLADEVAPPSIISRDEADRLRRGEFAPWSNPTTSKAAAEAIAPDLGELEAVVLRAIRHGNPCNLSRSAPMLGMTCEEAESYTGLSHQCASARIRGLVLKGLIRDSGETRRTRSGRSAIVWTVTA